MLTVLVGLTGALIYGAADFLGGLAAKSMSVLRVTPLAAAVGLVVLLAALPLIGGAWSIEAMILGAASGAAVAVALSLLYACLALGPMSILSPLTAIVSAVVPLAWGLAAGERFAVIGYLGLGLALLAVVLVGFVPERGAVRPSVRGLVMAVGSGTMLGVFLILLDATPEDSGLVPLVMNKATSAVLVTAALLIVGLVARRRRARARGSGVDGPAAAVRHGAGGALLLAVGCGVGDALANAVILLGVRIGDLSVMSVLTAMYPAGTILLAAVVLRERIAPVQTVGLVLALAAAALFALA